MRCKPTVSIHILFQIEKTAQMHTPLCEVGGTKSSKRWPETRQLGNQVRAFMGRAICSLGEIQPSALFLTQSTDPCFPDLTRANRMVLGPRMDITILPAFSKLTHFRPLCSQWSCFLQQHLFCAHHKSDQTKRIWNIFLILAKKWCMSQNFGSEKEFSRHLFQDHYFNAPYSSSHFCALIFLFFFLQRFCLS